MLISRYHSALGAKFYKNCICTEMYGMCMFLVNDSAILNRNEPKGF